MNLLSFKKKKSSSKKIPHKKQDRSSNFLSLEKSKQSTQKEKEAKEKNPEILEINLIKEEGDKFFDWNQNIAKLLFFVFLALIIVIEIYITLSWVETRNLNQSDFFASDFKTLNNEIREVREESLEAEEFKNKLDIVSGILDKHIYWTNFFDFLEKNTVDTVYYQSFNGDIAGRYQLTAKGKNFDDITDQVNAFLKNDNVTKVSVSKGDAISSNKQVVDNEIKVEKGVNFSIELEIQSELFSE